MNSYSGEIADLIYKQNEEKKALDQYYQELKKEMKKRHKEEKERLGKSLLQKNKKLEKEINNQK